MGKRVALGVRAGLPMVVLGSEEVTPSTQAPMMEGQGGAGVMLMPLVALVALVAMLGMVVTSTSLALFLFQHRLLSSRAESELVVGPGAQPELRLSLGLVELVVRGLTRVLQALMAPRSMKLALMGLMARTVRRDLLSHYEHCKNHPLSF